MLALHALLAFVTVALNVVVGVWGIVRSRHSASAEALARRERWFAQALALAQVLVFATGLFGLFVAAGHHHRPAALHRTVYGPFMAIAIVAAYGFRTDDARGNARIFGICALVVAALGARAIQTGFGG